MNEKIELISLNDIINDKTEPPSSIINNGILLDGTMLLIVGAKKSKKTFLTQNIGLAIASAKSFSGFDIPQAKKVVYFIAEGGYYPNRDRIKRMISEFDPYCLDNFMLSCTSYLPIDDKTSFTSMFKKIKDSGADVVIFDPFIRFHNVDENSASEMSKVFGKIRKLIKELGISVIIVHHTGKDSSRGGRGSSAILGEYDSCITINNERTGITRLSYDLRHAESPYPTNIRFNSETLWFEGNDPVVELLAKNEGSISKDEFLDKYDASKATVYRHIKKAIKDGLIKEKSGILELV